MPLVVRKSRHYRTKGKVSSGCKTLLKDFHDLEEKVKSLTTTLEDLEEGHKEMLKQKLFKKNTPLLMMNWIN